MKSSASRMEGRVVCATTGLNARTPTTGLDVRTPRGSVAFYRRKHAVGRGRRLSDRELGFDDQTQQSDSTIGLAASGLNAIRLDDRTLTVRLVDQTPRGEVIVFHRRKHAVGRGGSLSDRDLGFDDQTQQSGLVVDVVGRLRFYF